MGRAKGQATITTSGATRNAARKAVAYGRLPSDLQGTADRLYAAWNQKPLAKDQPSSDIIELLTGRKAYGEGLAHAFLEGHDGVLLIDSLHSGDKERLLRVSLLEFLTHEDHLEGLLDESAKVDLQSYLDSKLKEAVPQAVEGGVITKSEANALLRRTTSGTIFRAKNTRHPLPKTRRKTIGTGVWIERSYDGLHKASKVLAV